MSPPRQIPLSLVFSQDGPVQPFLTSETNFAAYSAVNSWPAWPNGRLAISGPRGVGKSHLAALWAERSGAARIPAVALAIDEVPQHLGNGALAVEDVDRLACSPPDEIEPAERALFHLLNLAQAEDASILLTGESAPGHWAVRTPGLSSRLTAMAHVRIAPPDDALLSSILAKFFAERRITVSNDEIRFLVRRIERSVGAAEAIVDHIDTASLARQRKVTRPFLAEIMAEILAETSLPDEAEER